MFTGIIGEVGEVASLDVPGTHARLVVSCRDVLDRAQLGESIAVDGCCLTIAELVEGGFAADLMAETLRATALGRLQVGSTVNLERALAAGDRLGGHLVQGHVDGVGEVVERVDEPGTTWIRVRAPAELGRYLVDKGSITVSGASLTVVDLEDAPDGTVFRVGLIPHTLEVTTFGRLAVGDAVNLEVDVIAKYAERLLAAGTASPYPPRDSLEDPSP